MLCPWLALIYCVKVYRFEITKVWNNCLACHRGCAWWEHSCLTKMEHGQTIWFCRDELSLAMLFWEDIIAWLVCLNIIIFMSILNFYLESFGSEHSCHNKENYIEEYARKHSTSKILFFIIYLLEDEQELSLGMLDTSPTYLYFLIVPCYYITRFGCLWDLLYSFISFLGLTY